MLDKELITTTVGSFPALPSKKEFMDAYPRGPDPFETCIREAVNAQLDAGIELVTDGQTRNVMIRLYASKLRGFRIRERISIVDDIAYRGNITVADQKYLRTIIPEDTGVKGVITGPVTLVNSVENTHYNDTYEAVMDAANALGREAAALAEVCDVIQLDEPFLSVEYPEFASETVERVFCDIDVPTSLHVCGDVSSIARELVELPVDILDHEFAANPQLFDVYDDIDHRKRMAVGVVTTDSGLESMDTILGRIRKAYDTFGTGCMIDPDCGLRMLTPEIAVKKLEYMVRARNVFMKEIN